MPNDDVKKQRQKDRAEIKRQVQEAEGTCVSVAEEGLNHIVDHWNPNTHPFFVKDYICVIYGGFFGHSKKEMSAAGYSEAFVGGNLHELSHHVADLMKEDKEFRGAILHAVEVWSRGAE